jgi:hypothetical protein
VDHSKKNDFWNELTNLGLSWQSPWVIRGDFNAIRNRREKNEVSLDKTNMQTFNCWIDAFALQDFKCYRQFTWARGVEALRWHALIDILLILHGLPYILLFFLVVFQELALIIHQFV